MHLKYMDVDALCAVWPHSEQMLFVLVVGVVHAITLWSFCYYFIVMENLGLISKYKLKRDQAYMNPKLLKNIKLNEKAYWEQIIGTFIVVPIGAFFLFYLFKYNSVQICNNSNELTVTILIKELALMMIGCDFLFYWIHRGLHHPLLYKHFHKQHHEYKASNVWASEYFGVVDMILNILPGVIPGVYMKAHILSIIIFTIIREWQTVQSHAGYELPWDILNFGVFHGGAKRHDFHHSHNIGCYGDWFPFWDWLCGTDVAYREYYKEDN